jgi:flagellar biosynthesis/type III secretory pathway M-ring protein FliF/YscJ
MDSVPFLVNTDFPTLPVWETLSTETMLMVLVVVFCSGLVFGLMISLQLSHPNTEKQDEHDESDDDEDSHDEELESEDEDVGRSLPAIPSHRRTSASTFNDEVSKVRIVQAAMLFRKKAPVQARDLGRMLDQIQSTEVSSTRRISLLRSYYPRKNRQSQAVVVLDALVDRPHLLHVAVGALLQRK